MSQRQIQHGKQQTVSELWIKLSYGQNKSIQTKNMNFDILIVFFSSLFSLEYPIIWKVLKIMRIVMSAVNIWRRNKQVIPHVNSVVGPLLFNIFIDDLLSFIYEAKLFDYADDNQLYFADTDPAVVEHVLNKIRS